MSRAFSASPATLCSVDSRCAWSVFTETTARRARCQRSWCSTSATATLNRLRMLGLQAAQGLPLVLEGPRPREMQVERQEADDHDPF